MLTYYKKKARTYCTACLRFHRLSDHSNHKPSQKKKSSFFARPQYHSSSASTTLIIFSIFPIRPTTTEHKATTITCTRYCLLHRIPFQLVHSHCLVRLRTCFFLLQLGLRLADSRGSWLNGCGGGRSGRRARPSTVPDAAASAHRVQG